MIPLKIPHLLGCFDFLVTSAYAKYAFIPRKSCALHLEHFKRNQESIIVATA